MTDETSDISQNAITAPTAAALSVTLGLAAAAGSSRSGR